MSVWSYGVRMCCADLVKVDGRLQKLNAEKLGKFRNISDARRVFFLFIALIV